MKSYSGFLKITKHSLNLRMMLQGGQSFRWKQLTDNQWIGVFDSKVWRLTQDESRVDFQVTTSENSNLKQLTGALKSYLRVDAPLEEYYEKWSSADEEFEKAAVQCHGIRILDQDPVENVFSFICSSNNNISRISSMVEKLCTMYGTKIAEIDGTDYYSFPNIEPLADESVEPALRKAGFGYRAKFIQKSAETLVSLGGRDWLESLKTLPYSEAKASLMKLHGIGAKVADCICLMSLGHLEAVPVDTHVFQIASQRYLPKLKSVKTVTDRVYNEIGDHFRGLFGDNAGWAHTILFCDDLKMFQKESKRKSKTKNLSEDNNIPLKKSKSSNSTKIKEDYGVYNHSESGVLNLSKEDLHLRVTLNCGQTYRWKEIGNDIWRGVFANRIWTLTQLTNNIKWSMTHLCPAQKCSPDCESLLVDYFRLQEPVQEFYKRWSRADDHFAKISLSFCGLRMTRQDIVENIFAFICSSNNTIQRITTMVNALCELYGLPIGSVDGETFYSFPTIESLSPESVKDKLKQANFGFRAKYVQQSANFIMVNGGQLWIDRLVKLPYENAKIELMKLPGVGPKVADCICLTALDHLNTIPVDVHVYHIASTYYLPHLKNYKTVTSKSYAEIGEFFRHLFGHFAGWAHTVLFCSDLRQHDSMCPEGLKKSPKKK